MRNEQPAVCDCQPRSGLVGLEQRLLVRARALGCPAGTAVVVGFSGGPDSLALAAALGRVAAMARLRLLLAHVDHALRDISHEEQETARRMAATLKLPFRALRASDPVRRWHPGVGLEEAARRERYRLLAGAANDAATGSGRGVIALAHHASDQAETVLLHLLRGSGLTGAGGMAERAERTVPWWEESDNRGDGAKRAAPPTSVVVWRPLVAETGATVRAYAASLGVRPIEDPSNRDRRFRRNALRHEALPMLERISPGATEALARFGRLAAEEEAALEALAETVVAREIRPDGSLRLVALAAEPVAIRRRVVRRWLRERTGYRGATADRTEALLRMIDAGKGGRKVEMGDGWTVRSGGGAIRVGRGLESGAGGRGDGS